MTDQPTPPDGTDRDDRRAATSDGATGPLIHRIECTVDWPPGHVACYLLAAEPVVFGDEVSRRR